MKLKLRLIRIVLLFFLVFSALSPYTLSFAEDLSQGGTCTEVIVHYHRPGSDYGDWGLHIWGPTDVQGVTWDSPFMPTGEDDYGLIWAVPMADGADHLNYIVHKGDEKDPGPDQRLSFTNKACEIWLLQGEDTQFTNADDALSGNITLVDIDLTESPEVGENQVIVHYRRIRGDYTDWGLHVWGSTPLVGEVTWNEPLMPTGQDVYGLYWVINVNEDAYNVNYIVHLGDEKDPGPDQQLVFEDKGREIWLIQGSGDQFSNPEAAIEALKLAAVGDITKLKAYWVSQEHIVWPVDYDPTNTYELIHNQEALIRITPQGLVEDERILLTLIETGLPDDLAERFPHLRNHPVFAIPTDQVANVPDILRGQIGVVATNNEGKLLDITGLQIPGVLDDIYTYDGPLGLTWEGDIPSFHLWAPTATTVTMLLYPDTNPDTQGIPVPMRFDEFTGVWSKEGRAKWVGQYYRFQVDVYVPAENRIVTNIVTDPYSIGLALNSTHSMIIDLNDPALIPEGWDELEKPVLKAPEDIVLYELHLRDFSINDETVPKDARGTFAAFTYLDSSGMQHMRTLAEAGLTHVHLLPVFDFATVNENKTEWSSPTFNELSAYPPDSEEQQSLVNETRTLDGFNWGYDPFHYTVPEGSYSTDPSNATRILEFRQMVSALNNIGRRVVMDVVYNHTNAAGQSQNSVLDKIVPGYYHRLNSNGAVESSTCCANTATENYMMERLMIDSVITWATAYKVDGFRFDLMGHHMKDNMVNLRQALDALTVETGGINGQEVFIYGEGWNFGEVGNNARGINATQPNMAGSGIGSFNDRGRDAARGGNPFGGLHEQGFITGLFTTPNEVENRPESLQRALLLQFSDIIRVTLAGNLAEYIFTDYTGAITSGAEVLYNGNPGAGYTADPQENIIYISAHDNETLFDAIQYKAPLDTSLEDRVRMQNMGISLVSLGQGVPFFHAGSELLRSKNLDRDSYDSGDWFNQLDFTYMDNNWGNGLPIADKNSSNWELMADLLNRPELSPTPENIQANLSHFIEMLQIRDSSPLFRLQTAADVQSRVVFHNTGPDQVEGMIVMSIDDRKGTDLDPNYEYIVVVFNGTNNTQSFSLGDEFKGTLALHSVQTSSADMTLRESNFNGDDNSLNVPARTTAVFVMEERLSLVAIGLLIGVILLVVIGTRFYIRSRRS